MRTPATLFLACLIALCPILCGAADAVLDAHAHADSPEPTAPTDCPESSDNCVCDGALVRPNDIQIPGVWEVLLPLPFLPHIPPHLLSPLTIDGSPPGLAALGDAPTIRAFLQTYRC